MRKLFVKSMVTIILAVVLMTLPAYAMPMIGASAHDGLQNGYTVKSELP